MINEDHYYYLHDNTNLYGAISNDVPELINGIYFCFSSASCTFDRLNIPGHPELSSGRVLRAFKLSTISRQLFGQQYIYTGLVIGTARAYNVAMGLVPFYTNIPVTKELIDFYIRHLDPEFDETRLIFNPDLAMANIMVFDMNPIKLAGHPITPYNIIKYMLPTSKTIARKGGSKKRNKKRKSKKYK